MIEMTNNIPELYRRLDAAITHTNKPIRVEIDNGGDVKEFHVWQKRVNGLIYIARQGKRELFVYSLSKRTGKMDFITSEFYNVLIEQGCDPKTGWRIQ